jgi:SAM-dependent methyltransferase
MLPPHAESDRNISAAAARVRAKWDHLARTPWRDFFVASIPNWNDPEAWIRQAANDVNSYLAGIDAAAVESQQILEIGCGVGRLAPVLARRTRGYTGIDISSVMLAEARERCRDVANARFFLCDGTGVSAEARDTNYGLILAVAVFIHCPRELVERNVASAMGVLAEGGSFRMQLRVDSNDPEVPICSLARYFEQSAETPPAALPSAPPRSGSGSTADPGPHATIDICNKLAEPDLTHAVSDAALRLTRVAGYAGHAFRVAEARELLQTAAPRSRVELYRPAADLLFGLIQN